MEANQIIALVALVTSLFTFYWTVLRGPRLSCPSPRVIGLIMPKIGAPHIGTTIFITNVGARSAEVDYLYIELCTPEDKHRFNCVLETTIRKAEKIYKEAGNGYPTITQEIYPKPFSIAPKAHILKDLLFASEKINEFPLGNFRLELYAILVGREKPVKLATREIEMKIKLPRGRFVEAVALKQHEVIVFDWEKSIIDKIENGA